MHNKISIKWFFWVCGFVSVLSTQIANAQSLMDGLPDPLQGIDCRDYEEYFEKPRRLYNIEITEDELASYYFAAHCMFPGNDERYTDGEKAAQWMQYLAVAKDFSRAQFWTFIWIQDEYYQANAAAFSPSAITLNDIESANYIAVKAAMGGNALAIKAVWHLLNDSVRFTMDGLSKYFWALKARDAGFPICDMLIVSLEVAITVAERRVAESRLEGSVITPHTVLEQTLLKPNWYLSPISDCL